jgi:hypothetical protein
MNYYCVIVSYQDDQEFVPVAESQRLEPMKQLAELICRHARPEISWVKVEDEHARLLFYWAAASYGERSRLLLAEPPVNDYAHRARSAV